EIPQPPHSLNDLQSLLLGDRFVISRLSIPTAWRMGNSAESVKLTNTRGNMLKNRYHQTFELHICPWL
ncbi:MAG: hypothetical protein KME57_16665, partial [Scytonema hyalinum WJT4-NPBG1]|nr:hypothetical protein [Scytonema hyalinum WJT4-NPBG1]